MELDVVCLGACDSRTTSRQDLAHHIVQALAFLLGYARKSGQEPIKIDAPLTLRAMMATYSRMNMLLQVEMATKKRSCKQVTACQPARDQRPKPHAGDHVRTHESG